MSNPISLTKSKYIGVYKKSAGFKPWITFIRSGDIAISINSESEEIAALKYNILANFFHGDDAVLNNVDMPPSVYNKTAREVYYQLTLPTNIQKSKSTQGNKRFRDASSEYVGVYKCKRYDLYNAYINKDSKRYSLGYYKTAYEAGAAYNIAAKALYGDSAKLNNIKMDSIDGQFTRYILEKLNLSNSEMCYGVRDG